MDQGHHSFMSASDAAPLPRLGEVFFDVRGSSRSMRLSWYADTGVAVFSIWQGGMCTGTFRLPIGDLPRMVEILQAGPHGRGPAGVSHAAGSGGGAYGGQDYPTGSVMRPGADEGYPGDYPGDPGPGYGRDEPGYGRDDPRYGRDEPGYGRDDPRYGRDESGYGRDESGYGPDESGYGRGEAADSRRPPYPVDEPREPTRVAYAPEPLEFPEPGGGRYGRDAFPDDRPDYRAEYPAEAPRGSHGRDDAAETMAAGYGQERFVPPYVQNPAGEYGNDIPARAADMPTGPRHGAYRDDGLASRSPADEYEEPQWAPADYSDGRRHR
jgi:hypothetical protein